MPKALEKSVIPNRHHHERRGRDSNPRWSFPHTAFPVLHNRPLCHLSDGGILFRGPFGRQLLRFGARGGMMRLTQYRRDTREETSLFRVLFWVSWANRGS